MSQDLNGPIFDKIHRDGMGYVWEISDEATVAAAGGKVKRGEGLEYIKGADATELAANMGVDAAALAETIEAYNAAVDSGVDREIGGFPTAKLEAPFLAVPVVPCEIITYGGVARTEQGEVIRADGEVMLFGKCYIFVYLRPKEIHEGSTKANNQLYRPIYMCLHGLWNNDIGKVGLGS